MSVEYDPTFDPKSMPFRRLGRTGLQVSLLSFGAWIVMDFAVLKDMIKTAWDHGVNTFDNAEIYHKGEAEIQMGKAFKELKLNRQQLVVFTKIMFGTGRLDPNQRGLSRKHVIEGLKASLRRLQLDYVDVVFAHRDDPNVSMEEIVRAFSFVIDQGLAFYWSTSEWSAARIIEAHHVAEKLGLHAPVAEQPHHSALHRTRVEDELVPVFEKYGYGSTIWSPLEGGLLTGKYNDGVPKGTRYDVRKDIYKNKLDKFDTPEGKAEIEKVRKLSELAGKLDTTVSRLSLAWAAKNKNVSTILLGASKPEQLEDNFKSLEVIDKLTPEYMELIEKILDNNPSKEQK